MMDQDDEEIVKSDYDDIYPPSPLSSSPPREFDINPEDQYMPLDGNDHETSSLASSLSIGSERDSPFIISSVAEAKSTRTSQTASSASNSSRVIRCPVCEKPMRTFYCAKCIQKGRFVTLEQQPHRQERFIDNRMGYDDSKEIDEPTHDNEETQSTTKIVDENKILEDMLQVKLRTLTRRTDMMKALYDNQKARLEATRRSLRESKQEVEMEKKQYKQKESKIDLIKKFIASRKASVKKRRDAEANLLDELKQHISRRIYQLTQDVFPIEQVNLLDQNNSFVNMETSPLLTFSDGSHHQIEQSTAYSIVEPWLPSNGDYSAYSLWVNDNKDQAPVNDSSERGNPAFQIGAALAYTTQFVKNLASYLDVILPVRMELDMFNKDLLDDATFSYNVAKLNANVIHLCVSQGIDVSLLNSHRTLKNLLLLFDINLSDLGRKPIIELDNDEAARRVEQQLVKDLSLIHEDFYDVSKFATNDAQVGNGSNNEDNDDVSDSEWEISDSVNPIEMHQMAAEQQMSVQQNSYIARPFRLFSSFWTASGS